MRGFALTLAVGAVLALAPAVRAELPVLKVVPNDAGEAVASWTLPAGHQSWNLHWSTDPSTVAVGSGDPSEGRPMTCFMSGPADGTHDCVGGRDLGSTQVSSRITGLAPGAYYAQVQTMGHKQWTDPTYNVTQNVSYYGWSAVVPFTVAKPKPEEPLPLLTIPAATAANGAAECAAARATLQGVRAQAAKLNVTIAGLKGLSEAQHGPAVKLIALAQRLVDEAAADARKWCTAVTAGGYGLLPPDNGTAGCRAARAHIASVNGELRKAYGNLAFATPTDGSKWVRIQQLQTRIARLLADLDRSAPKARAACARR